MTTARGRADSKIVRAASKKTKAQPAKLQRRTRTYSFSPGREDALMATQPPGMRQANGQAVDAGGARAFERIPTLHHKRNDYQPVRRKSSKRRREDHEREAEIKAMSAHMPKLSAEDAWPADRLRRSSIKRSKTEKPPTSWRHPESDTSLPLDEQLLSTNSSDLDVTSYKVSILSSLAPRPTLRYASASQRVASRRIGTIRASPPPGQQHDEIIEEPHIDSTRRMDDLADGLDSSDIRELMERDFRRRERQRLYDQAKLEKKLSRRAEQAQEDVRDAAAAGIPPPQNTERGVMGRELAGLGIDPPSAVVTSSEHAVSPSPDRMSGVEVDSSAKPAPLDTFKTTYSIKDAAKLAPAVAVIAPAAEEGSPLPDLPQPLPTHVPRVTKSRSTLGSDKGAYDKSRQGSDASGRGSRRSFSFFLNWGNRSKRQSAGPPSFSNTSREEMQFAAAQSQTQLQSAAQAQAEALAKLQGEDVPSLSSSLPALAKSRATSGVPKRTRSRFREDLPEFPLSPPDSRVQSPEADVLPSVTETSPVTKSQPIAIPMSLARRSIENMMSSTQAKRSSAATSSDQHVSVSLASIDSEGSWLSGKVTNRRSQALRDSILRASRRDAGQSTDSLTNSTKDDLAITDDDYLSRVTPTLSGHDTSRLSGEGLPSSDEDEDEDGAKWGTVGAQPELVQSHNRGTMHSFHGLLNTADSDNESNVESPISPSVVENATMERAHSVNMGKGHVRNFSAGSAKLLDITPRGSVDGKHLSVSGLKDSK